MARRIADAMALGCRWIITETGEKTPERLNPSYHNMLCIGFKLAYTQPNYMLAALLQANGLTGTLKEQIQSEGIGMPKSNWSRVVHR